MFTKKRKKMKHGKITDKDFMMKNKKRKTGEPATIEWTTGTITEPAERVEKRNTDLQVIERG